MVHPTRCPLYRRCARAKLRITLVFSGFVLLTLGSVSTASAAQTLFYIVRKADWLAKGRLATYQPVDLKTDGFLLLLTPEQVIPAAQASFRGKTDLLLLKLSVPTTDPCLKWVNLPGGTASLPRYYGALPRLLVKKTYAFQPRKDGTFALPALSFFGRLIARLTPARLVTKLLSYHDWQETERFGTLQAANFGQPKVRLQWWYFDFFLRDGSSMVLAFIPQHWWDEPGPAAPKTAVLMLSLKTKQGLVKRFSATVPQSDLETAADYVELPGRLKIQAVEDSGRRYYIIRVNFPQVQGDFVIQPTQPPFAAFPTGMMPGILQTVLSGAPLGAPRFSYVSQIPNGRVTGTLAWDDVQTRIDGQAYHEQGRLDDTPAHQASYWTWYHFAGEGWTIFGSPGTYIYLQKNDQILRSGFQLITQNYTLTNRTFASPDHARLLTGGQITFRHDSLSFRLALNPALSKTLICFPSADPNQVWGTVEGKATLFVTEGSQTKRVEGRMFLETCSWETAGGRKP